MDACTRWYGVLSFFKKKEKEKEKSRVKDDHA